MCSQVTEEQLAMVFQECGRVLDCRICGDPNSIMRFAFIEFYELESAERVGCCVLAQSPEDAFIALSAT